MKVKSILMAVGAAIVVGLLCFRFLSSGEDGERSSNGDRKTARARISSVKAKAVARRAALEQKRALAQRQKKHHPSVRSGKRGWFVEAGDFDDDAHPYSSVDKAVAKALQSALDELDSEAESDDGPKGRSERASRVKRLLSAAAKAAASSNPSVRQRAVEAYSWLGNEALAEMTPMMADPDETVADAAIDSVETTLMGIDDQQELFFTAAAYLNTFQSNENAISMLGGVMEGAAAQIIDPEDPDLPSDIQRAAQNRADIADALAGMVEKGGKLSDQAKASYELITGYEWAGAEEAKLWAQDPDNYEPPEVP